MTRRRRNLFWTLALLGGCSATPQVASTAYNDTTTEAKLQSWGVHQVQIPLVERQAWARQHGIQEPTR